MSDDPRPEPFDADGRWTSEFLAWARREGQRMAARFRGDDDD